MDLIEQIKKRTEEFFSDSRGSHDWEHTLRVYNLCLHMGKKENADMKILCISAILHDIGRKHQDECKGKICHAQKGAELAKELLSEFDLSGEEIAQIIHCIETHRFRGNKIPILDKNSIDEITKLIKEAFELKDEKKKLIKEVREEIDSYFDI